MRKSIFDILSHSRYFTDKIFNTKVLDVFAGSGIMGIECLSRGSTYCKFIDNSNESINTINKNLGNLNIKLHSSVIKLDAIHPPATTEKYGLSFFDPPYSTLNFSTIILLVKNVYNLFLHSQTKEIILNIFPQFKYYERLKIFNQLSNKLRIQYDSYLILGLIIVDESNDYEYFCHKYKAVSYTHLTLPTNREV